VACCFHPCPRCKKDIYDKAYSYHTYKCEPQCLADKGIVLGKTKKVGRQVARDHEGRRWLCYGMRK
jgi:hypothetical protein